MEIHISCIYVLHHPNPHPPPIPSHFSIQKIYKVESRVQSPVLILDYATVNPVIYSALTAGAC